MDIGGPGDSSLIQFDIFSEDCWTRIPLGALFEVESVIECSFSNQTARDSCVIKGHLRIILKRLSFFFSCQLSFPGVLLVVPKILIFSNRFARMGKSVRSLVLTSELLHVLRLNESSVVLIEVLNVIVEVHLFANLFLVVSSHIG